MFAKKVKVKWKTRCHKCDKELVLDTPMLLMVYYPTFFDYRSRTVVKGEKATAFMCTDCLGECVVMIEAEGHYALEFSSMAQKKRMRAALKEQ